MKAFIALSALLALASADQSSHQTIQHGHAAPVHTSIHKPHGVHHASVVSQPAADPSDVHNPYHADHKPIAAVHAPAHVPVHAPYQPAPYHPAPYHPAHIVQRPAPYHTAPAPYHPAPVAHKPAPYHPAPYHPAPAPYHPAPAPSTQLRTTQPLLLITQLPLTSLPTTLNPMRPLPSTNTDMPSLMTMQEPTLLKTKTETDTPPLVNTELVFPMVVLKSFPTRSMMRTLDMLLMSDTREKLTMIPTLQLTNQPLITQLLIMPNLSKSNNSI
ncbi:uncharacterized protein [Lepeophtheirus salmonis]|uniref:uncharacterized protein n=1 Tax=Lepeophtheirus salmonis TaxID=72036 RepID=UPI001AE2A7BB|nr:proline-rich extensin-like protein EPR1 isoform X1 [Lepeophtheirus salmonis]XP_040581804.1 proline-rich extensin-like protein EPR1 isoform X2 [Lepeophtheirus salmonis]